jgi:hypothetical protein
MDYLDGFTRKPLLNRRGEYERRLGDIPTLKCCGKVEKDVDPFRVIRPKTSGLNGSTLKGDECFRPGG